METPLQRLYKTKIVLFAVIAGVIGSVLLLSAHWVATQSYVPELRGFPVADFGAVLLTSSVVVIGFTYLDHQNEEARESERLARVVRQEAPAIRDAVLDSFAFDPVALKNVASPETLDRIATNAIGLRLGDEALARDVYTDVRNQVISLPDRWHDVDVSVDLSPWNRGPATGHGSMFVVTLRWEYRVVPTSPTLRFACVSDPGEYRELLRDTATTSVWYLDPSARVDAASRDVFELVQVSANGKPLTVRRTERKGTQLYNATLPQAAMNGETVTVAYTYRVLTQRHGHVVYLDLPRPAKGFKAKLNYDDAGIRRINILDFIASAEQTRIAESPSSVPGRSVDIGFDGWIFPRSGVAFVWVLEDELDTTPQEVGSSQ